MKQIRKLLMSFVLMAAGLTASAQQQVTGTVVDDSGEPIIGATVIEKGTSKGAVTSLGYYDLSGKRIAKPTAKGIYIEKVNASNGTTISRKFIVR